MSEVDAYDGINALLRFVGEDPNREGLKETPKRMLTAWRFWTSGYRLRVEDVLKTFADGAEDYHDLVFQGNTPFYSICEHHLAPFFGVAHIGYIPSGRVVGLSKLARVVEIFARRLQCQERITKQVTHAIYDVLQPKAVGVVLRARHMCVESRGVQKPGSVTYTSCLLGAFQTDQAARNEFLRFVEKADGQTSI